MTQFGKIAHIQELRDRIREKEADLSLAEYPFTDLIVGHSVTYKHILELREATELVLDAMGKTLYDFFNYDEDGNYMGTTKDQWTDETLDATKTIRYIHIEDLRHPFPVTNIDYIINDIRVSTVPGQQTYKIDVDIKNVGTKDCIIESITNVQFEIFTTNITTPGINANTIYTATVYVDYDNTKPLISRIITSIADSTHVIEESREDNNTLSKIFTLYPPDNSARIIVHCHNPEGKEIGSIRGVSQVWTEIYDGSIRIGYGAINESEHYKQYKISVGMHDINVRFNGMVLSQIISIQQGELKELTFNFIRTEFFLSSFYPYNVTDTFTSYASYHGGSINFFQHYLTCGFQLNGVVDAQPYSWNDLFSLVINSNGAGYNFIMHQHHYARATFPLGEGAYTKTTVSIQNPIGSIPSYTTFTWWHSQGVYEGPGNWTTVPSGTPTVIGQLIGHREQFGWTMLAPLNPGGDGYAMRRLAANRIYNIQVYIRRHFLFSIPWGGSWINIDADRTNDYVNFTNWKISSVPYDIMGTAV